jgi:oligopeptide/dipeptide ABC transporter ATP-binding protein
MSADDPTPLLEVETLSTEFHTSEGIVHAVNSVSFSIFKGETVAFVGESGSGKSVTMLSILGLLFGSHVKVMGNVRFIGMELLEQSRAEMQRIRGAQIGMIFQDPMTSLNPVLTIGHQITEALRRHMGMSGISARARTVELLQDVGIPHAESRLGDYPHQFSGGMRQRVMIAMAISCRPALLIADEPTTALDVTIQAQIVELVSSLRERLGMSLIWITHDLGVVAGIADRVLVMYAGSIVEQASVFELYAKPLHPYTRGLLRSIPSIDRDSEQELESIEGIPPDPFELPPGCPFEPRCRFRRGICRDRNPTLYAVNVSRQVACWVDVETGKKREAMLRGTGTSRTSHA